MLNIQGIKKVHVLGGGTAGWLAALHLRELFHSSVHIQVISAPEIPIVGVGEGGIVNLMQALNSLKIPIFDMINKTGAVHKLGFSYEGWRSNNENKKDVYYHMFPLVSDKIFDRQHGYYPAFAALASDNIPISYSVDSIRLHERNTSQEELNQMFQLGGNANFTSSLHFDTYKVGQYLREIALSRGITHKEATLKDIQKNSETGLVEALLVNDEWVKTDFIIDATGFSRQLIGKHLKTDWCSFKEYLPQNTAIPFHLKHPEPNPGLVTRGIAMNSGWMWQIPLQHRIGAGYVFNRDFISPDKAVAEIEQYLGHEIDPIRTIQFEAGCFKEVWKGNVMAIGLASGFVEPLEANSIAQTLIQLQYFMNTMEHTAGVVSQGIIDNFNKENLKVWAGIRDFLRMHYDTGRVDTPFWRMTQNLPLSDVYTELKKVWQYRTPRAMDFINYEMYGVAHFEVYSWFAIAQALNIIPKTAALHDMAGLSFEKQQKLKMYVQKVKYRQNIA